MPRIMGVKLAGAKFLIGGRIFATAFAVLMASAQTASLLACNNDLPAVNAALPTRPNPGAGLIELPDSLTGIGYKGFLTSIPDFSPENFAATMPLGILEWSIEIYTARSIEEAKQHDERENNPLNRGLYFIAGLPLESVKQDHAADTFKLLSRDGLYYFTAGVPHKVPPSYLASRFSTDPSRLSMKVKDNGKGSFFHLRGWFYPKFRGVLHIKDTPNSSAYRDVRNLARAYFKKGFRVKFNTDFEMALQKLAVQVRRNQDVSLSRFLDPNVQSAMRNLHAHGQAFFAELWNEKNEMVAGALVIKNGNTFMIDTVFYPPEKNMINQAKILSLAITERLLAAGVEWQDYQTVSNFSGPLGVRLIPVANFERLRSQALPANPDFFTPWTPPEPGTSFIIPTTSPSYELMGPPLSEFKVTAK